MRRIVQRLAVVGALTVAAVAAQPAGPAAAAPLSGRQAVEHTAATKCIDLQNSSQANGAAVQQWDCFSPSRNNQAFNLVNLGNGYYQLKFRHSGKCLDVINASTLNGTLIQQWTCIPGQHNQHFRFDLVHGDYYEIIAEHSGKCLDVINALQANGTRLQQWDCLGRNNQHFRS